jgi:hypothetical protein
MPVSCRRRWSIAEHINSFGTNMAKLRLLLLPGRMKQHQQQVWRFAMWTQQQRMHIC